MCKPCYDSWYAKNNPEKVALIKDRWRRNNPDKVKEINRKYNYGIKEGVFAMLMEKQGGKCAICPDEAAHTDHDHRSGAIRGLLCGRCNIGIGCFDDSPSRIRSAIQYLGEFLNE